MEGVARVSGGVVEAARHGDSTAFEAIYREYQAPIAGYLCRVVGDPDVAADLTQDVFVSAYKAIGRTEPSLDVRPWLFRIATNAAMSHHRRRRLLRWVPLVGSEGHVSGPEQTSAGRDELAGALAALPPDQAACLLLSLHQGFSYEEIGAMLGVSPGAVKTRVYRARLALARALRAGQEER